MSVNLKLRPKQDVLQGVLSQLDVQLTNVRENYAKRIENIEKHYALAPKLTEAGFELKIWEWDDLEYLSLNLGEKPTSKRGLREFNRKLQAIRRIVGCPLELEGKSVHNARKKLVEVTVRAKAYPNFRITYQTRLPSNAKCKIVRSKYRSVSHSLVCESN